MVIVGRPLYGITLNNELEYVLDNDGEIMKFNSIDTAKEWLTAHGVDEDYMQLLMFLDEDGNIIEI